MAEINSTAKITRSHLNPCVPCTRGEDRRNARP